MNESDGPRASKVAVLFAVAIIALVSVSLAFEPEARAQDSRSGECAPEVQAWVDACARGAHRTMQPDVCADGRIVIRVDAPGSAPLRVEVSRGAERAFRHVGTLGFAPVGSFDDWDTQPAGIRTGFDALLACATANPSLSPEHAHVAHLFQPDIAGRDVPDAVPPLSFLLGVACALALGVRGWLRASRQGRITAVQVAALGAGTWVVQHFITPNAFFHQNGQGPLWVHYAACWSSTYGPGYAEMFHAATRAAPRSPEAELFVAQSFLGATMPVAAWIIARHAGGSRWFAWSLAVALAVSPVLARLDHSETYYLTCAALLFGAAALLAAGARPFRLRSVNFALGVVGAGALIAQAARVHPVAWVPAALVPAVLLMGPGRFRRKATIVAVAGVGTGLVASAGALMAIIGVVHGSLGERWIKHSDGHPLPFRALPLIVLLLVPFARPRQRALLAAGVFAAAFTVARRFNVVANVPGYVELAYYLLYLPVVIAAVAALASTVARTRIQARALAAFVLACGLGFAVVHRAALRLESTDAVEGARALAWRERIPSGQMLVFLARAGRRLVTMPVGSRCDARGIHVLELRSGESPGDPRAFDGEWYYYRSSLCSTDDGRAVCDAFESRLVLEPLDEATLPGVASMLGMDYSGPVRVGLYRARLR